MKKTREFDFPQSFLESNQLEKNNFIILDKNNFTNRITIFSDQEFLSCDCV